MHHERMKPWPAAVGRGHLPKPDIEDVPRGEAGDAERVDGLDPQYVAAIEQRHVDAALVGRLAMYVAIAQFIEHRLPRQARNRQPVLHLGQAHDGRQFAGFVGRRQHHLRDAVAFPRKAVPGPVPFGPGRELVVILQGVVERIEQILDVPKHNYQRPKGRTDLPPHSFAVFELRQRYNIPMRYPPSLWCLQRTHLIVSHLHKYIPLCREGDILA